MTRLAIVGAGYMAAEHARAFASWPGVEIVGICGRNRDRAQILADSVQAPCFDSIAAMHRSTGADAVVVAVNELSMQTVCAQVFAHPWAALLEKPLGLHLGQAQEITAMARDHRAWVALNRRAYGATRAALAALQAQSDGGPRLISVLDQQNMADARTGGQPEEVVRNYMYANSIHLVDYLNAFGRGEVTEVRHGRRFDADSPGHLLATVHYSSGDIGVYQAVWDGPGPWAVAVTDRHVRVEMRPLERATLQRRGERRAVDLPADPIDTTFKPGLHCQAGWMLDELSGRPTPLADLSEALRSMALVASVYGV